jgi:hypothetical protein
VQSMTRAACAGVCLSIFVVVLTGCVLRQGNRVLIPAGYVGWIRVYYDVQGAPPLPVEAGKRLINVPANGIVRTSSDHDSRYGVDEYFYLNPDGTLTKLTTEGVENLSSALVHNHVFQSSQPTIHIFFVGPKAALKDHPRPDA